MNAGGRRARHALDAAGHEQVALTGPDGLGRAGHALEARAAEAVEGLSRYLDGKSRQQPRHPGDVSIVFPGLVGAAENHVFHPAGRKAAAVAERADGGGGERSSGRMSARTPPARPIGVRTAAVMKASVTGIDSAERKRKA